MRLQQTLSHATFCGLKIIPLFPLFNAASWAAASRSDAISSLPDAAPSKTMSLPGAPPSATTSLPDASYRTKPRFHCSFSITVRHNVENNVISGHNAQNGITAWQSVNFTARRSVRTATGGGSASASRQARVPRVANNGRVGLWWWPCQTYGQLGWFKTFLARPASALPFVCSVYFLSPALRCYTQTQKAGHS